MKKEKNAARRKQKTSGHDEARLRRTEADKETKHSSQSREQGFRRKEGQGLNNSVSTKEDGQSCRDSQTNFEIFI